MSSSSPETNVGVHAGAKAVMPLIGRAAMSCLFLISGIEKLAAPKETIAYIASAGLPFAHFGFMAAVLIEVVGGLLLVLGMHTRPVAAIMAIFSVVTTLVFHSELDDQMQSIQFLKNVAIAGGLMQVVAFGPGWLSVDAWKSARTVRSRSAI